jgi:hypothetical protein
MVIGIKEASFFSKYFLSIHLDNQIAKLIIFQEGAALRSPSPNRVEFLLPQKNRFDSPLC